MRHDSTAQVMTHNTNKFFCFMTLELTFIILKGLKRPNHIICKVTRLQPGKDTGKELGNKWSISYC